MKKITFLILLGLWALAAPVAAEPPTRVDAPPDKGKAGVVRAPLESSLPGLPSPDYPRAAPRWGGGTVVIAGTPGAPGPQGLQGPAGRPPTAEEIQEALVAYLNANNGAPAPKWAKPSLEEAVRQGLVQGFPDGTYRWLRPATRAEVGIVVERAWVKTQAALTQIRKDLEEESAARKGADDRHDREIEGLGNEDLKIWSAMNWRDLIIVFFVTACSLAAAAFGLLAAMAAARQD